MKRVMLHALILILALLGSGCTASVPQVALNVRPGYTRQIKDVLVVVRTDGVPAEFSSVFISNLERLLKERGIETRVRPTSELDLNPVTPEHFKGHEHVLLIRPTHVLSNQYAVQRITMNCTLVDVATDVLVMRADVIANKGWGTGFSVDEAQNATAELIRQMEERRLLPTARSDSTAVSVGTAARR